MKPSPHALEAILITLLVGAILCGLYKYFEQDFKQAYHNFREPLDGGVN